jgi:hypothetical protein
MREPISGPLVESSVLYVFADYPGTLLIAATKEVATIVMGY